MRSLGPRLSASQRRPLPARIFPGDSNFPSTAALETLMRPVTLETTGDPLPGTPDPRCWVGESWPHRHMLPHVIAWVLMVMDILGGRKGMLHT